jgi:hypothetical protein
MRPEVEQELAHTLLVELLAYQFASPVRWIETQDVILGEKTTERIVEVGPADTLGVMAKRTLAAKYEAYDAARSVQRQVLCYKKDGPDIYYDVEPIEDEPVAAAPASSSAAPSAGAPVAAAPVAAAAPPPGAGPAAAVADAPVGAVDILRTLVAQKLKKPLTDIPLSKAIKDLVGGKLAKTELLQRTTTDSSISQANPPSRTKSSATLEKSLVLHLKSPRTPLSTSWEPLCSKRSMDSLESSPLRSLPAWSHQRCLVASTLLLCASTWRHAGVWPLAGRTVSFFSP